jgi:ATP-dependent RNA helicase DHX57
MPKGNHPPRSGQNKKPSAAEAKPNAAESKPSSAAGTSLPKEPKKGKGPVVKDENSATGKKSGSNGSSAVQPDGVDLPAKKPDTRTLIAGASWTGKLPVALLSEMCQKQKWNKPEYTMVSENRPVFEAG